MWNKTDPEESFRNKVIWVAAAVVAAALIGVGVYYRFHTSTPMATSGTVPSAPPAAAPAPASAPLPSAAQAPAIAHPVPAPSSTAGAQPLPPLNHSDAVVLAALDTLIGHPAVARFIVPKNIIRRVVVSVDSLPRAKVSADLRPIQATPGETVVNRQGAVVLLSQRNYARYTPFVAVVSRLNVQGLAQLYGGREVGQIGGVVPVQAVAGLVQHAGQAPAAHQLAQAVAHQHAGDFVEAAQIAAPDTVDR